MPAPIISAPPAKRGQLSDRPLARCSATAETATLTVELAAAESVTGEVWANRREPIEGAEVTHIFIQRNLPFSDVVQIRVFVNGTRGSGYLDADAQGNILAVNQG